MAADRSKAASHTDWQIEAEYQMGAKLEAQQALWLIIKALDLNPAELPAGWGASTTPILNRIEAIVDEADRLARERDRARHLVVHLFRMITLEQWRDTGGDDGQGHYEGDLYEAFVAGFKSSGEGWNGEYPFDDKGIDVAASSDIQAAFSEWVAGRG